ncbi:protein jagged-1-like [Lingula anatina]|uniref:Protein jagged-1-like n=1 Tax=Lingula anatina TaxID=7574 RepID=A0A1S3H7U7_LINAN|nr:protein jagged-1-like [Lingula anatina]|eukprot:XP_013382190.1 protein jagged-1-like [Lingula anatina]
MGLLFCPSLALALMACVFLSQPQLSQTYGCKPDSCYHNGTCEVTTDYPSGFQCFCQHDYYGERCELKMCGENSHCMYGIYSVFKLFDYNCDLHYGYRCVCDEGYRYDGGFCQEICHTDSCFQNGFCEVNHEEPLGFKCVCDPGFFGERCALKSVE